MLKGEKRKRIVNPISVLYMPDEQCELYFWYDGNPFGFQEDNTALVLPENSVVCPTEELGPQPLEIARSIYEYSEVIGYLVARKNYMVVGLPNHSSSRISYEIISNYFPSTNSHYRFVPDEKQKIAKTGNIFDRMNRVFAAQNNKSMPVRPEIVLHLPPKTEETDTMPDAA